METTESTIEVRAASPVNEAAQISEFGRARETVRGAPLAPDELAQLDAFWRACNYLALGMIYLRDNPHCASRSGPST